MSIQTQAVCTLHVLGLIYTKASICLAAAVCPVVRLPFGGLLKAVHIVIQICSFSVVLNFQKCSVCSFLSCEQMFFSRVGRE